MRVPRLSTAPDGWLGDSPAAAARRQAALWRPVALLGRGGTAEVWLGVDSAGRNAALKRPRADLPMTPGIASLLEREHRWLGLFAHEPFVAAHGFDQHDVPTLVLEYLPGGDLVSLVGAPPTHWLPAVQRVARALSALRSHGLAHGDLKARNVLFGGDGAARVIDLTAVVPLDAPAPRATAAYRPAGEGVTGEQADAFALAALIHELGSGRLPYGAKGQGFVGEEPVDADPKDSIAVRLLASARRELVAGGRRGLSPLLDVIESVRAG